VVKSFVVRRREGVARTLPVFEVLEFQVMVAQYLPDKGQLLIHYFNWYSNKERGLRNKMGRAFLRLCVMEKVRTILYFFTGWSRSNIGSLHVFMQFCLIFKAMLAKLC